MAKYLKEKMKRASVFDDFLVASWKEEFIDSVEGICRGNDAGLINLKIKTCDAGMVGEYHFHVHDVQSELSVIKVIHLGVFL
jgi:hypothetical protein